MLDLKHIASLPLVNSSQVSLSCKDFNAFIKMLTKIVSFLRKVVYSVCEVNFVSLLKVQVMEIWNEIWMKKKLNEFKGSSSESYEHFSTILN